MPAADLVADPGLVQALQTARAWGASPSVFAGARARTSFVYDETGRVVGTVAAPTWTAEDRDLAYALAEYEAGLCACGRPMAETMDPAHEFAYRGRLAGRCHACTAQATAAGPYEATPHPGALRFAVDLDPVAAALGVERVAAQQAVAEQEVRDGGWGADGAGAAPGTEPGAQGGG